MRCVHCLVISPKEIHICATIKLYVQTVIHRIETMAANDADTILQFTDAQELRKWALLRNKLFDCDVRNRLLQLEETIKIQGVKVCELYAYVAVVFPFHTTTHIPYSHYFHFHKITTFFSLCLQIKCRSCKCCFLNRKDLYRHKKIHHMQTGFGDLQEQPFSNDNAPWKLDDGTNDLNMMEEYTINSDTILHKSEEGEFFF